MYTCPYDLICIIPRPRHHVGGRDPERALLSRLVGETVTLASVRFSPIIVEPGRDSLDLMHGQSVVMQGDFLCKNCEGEG